MAHCDEDGGEFEKEALFPKGAHGFDANTRQNLSLDPWQKATPFGLSVSPNR